MAEFASNPNYIAPVEAPYLGEPTKVAMTEDQRANGFIPEQPMAAEHLNYELNAITARVTAVETLMPGKVSVAASPLPPASVTNSISPITCLSFTIPANELKVGSRYRLVADFEFVHAAGATPHIRASVNVNGLGANDTLNSTSAGGTYCGRFEGYLTCETIGISGTLRDSWALFHTGGSPLLMASNHVHQFIDTTSAITVALTMQMSAAVAGNTLRITNTHAERLN